MASAPTNTPAHPGREPFAGPMRPLVAFLCLTAWVPGRGPPLVWIKLDWGPDLLHSAFTHPIPRSQGFHHA